MNKKDQLKFKKILLEKRNDLLDVVKSKKERDLIDVEIGDEIDSASQAVEKGMLFELSDNEKTMLDSIESALRRIEKGSYGKCESCGKDIPQKRLIAIPWVRYDIGCQSKSEKPR
jgi:DnaK suppressor protein